MRERRLVGLDALSAATTLLQHVRRRDPEAGTFEAADLQWWWRTHRATDDVEQLVWVDREDTPIAAARLTAWKDSCALDPIVLPGADIATQRRVVERGLEHAADLGLAPIDVSIPADDQTMLDVLASCGLSDLSEEGVDGWLDASARPAVSSLADGYRLVSRADSNDRPHHFIQRGGPDVEPRLQQTSLYRPDLDLIVLHSDAIAAYGLFWYDPTTRTGLVEPMRTEEDHQGRGLARHVITSGIDRLASLGAERIKIACDPTNEPAFHLYSSVGFGPWRRCVVAARPPGS